MRKQLILRISVENSDFSLTLQCTKTVDYATLVALARVKSGQYTGALRFRFDLEKNFSKKLYILETDFKRICENCDLLLFE